MDPCSAHTAFRQLLAKGLGAQIQGADTHILLWEAAVSPVIQNKQAKESKIISKIRVNEHMSVMIVHGRAVLPAKCCPLLSLPERRLDQFSLPEMPAHFPKDDLVLIWQVTGIKTYHHLGKNKMDLSQKRNYIPVLSKSQTNSLQLSRGERNWFGERSCWAQHSFHINRRLCHLCEHCCSQASCSQLSLQKLALPIISFLSVCLGLRTVITMSYSCPLYDSQQFPYAFHRFRWDAASRDLQSWMWQDSSCQQVVRL